MVPAKALGNVGCGAREVIVRDSRSPRGRDEGPHKTTSVLDLDFVAAGLGSGNQSWTVQYGRRYVNLRDGKPKRKAA